MKVSIFMDRATLFAKIPRYIVETSTAEIHSNFSLTLLTKLYDNVLQQQGACDTARYQVAIKLFMRTLRPVFDISENWYLTGEICDDRREYFIKRFVCALFYCCCWSLSLFVTFVAILQCPYARRSFGWKDTKS
jgi:hypothetical protein